MTLLENIFLKTTFNWSKTYEIAKNYSKEIFKKIIPRVFYFWYLRLYDTHLKIILDFQS